MGKRCLEVTIGSTAGLKENRTSTRQDPYAVIWLGGQSFRTDSDPQAGSRPVWNHRFSFLLPENASDPANPQELEVQVWDKADPQDKYIGHCKVPLSQVYNRGSMDAVQAVHRKSGKLLGHIRFHLSVLVEESLADNHSPPPRADHAHAVSTLKSNAKSQLSSHPGLKVEALAEDVLPIKKGVKANPKPQPSLQNQHAIAAPLQQLGLGNVGSVPELIYHLQMALQQQHMQQQLFLQHHMQQQQEQEQQQQQQEQREHLQRNQEVKQHQQQQQQQQEEGAKRAQQQQHVQHQKQQDQEGLNQKFQHLFQQQLQLQHQQYQQEQQQQQQQKTHRSPSPTLHQLAMQQASAEHKAGEHAKAARPPSEVKQESKLEEAQPTKQQQQPSAAKAMPPPPIPSLQKKPIRPPPLDLSSVPAATSATSPSTSPTALFPLTSPSLSCLLSPALWSPLATPGLSCLLSPTSPFYKSIFSMKPLPALAHAFDPNTTSCPPFDQSIFSPIGASEPLEKGNLVNTFSQDLAMHSLASPAAMTPTIDFHGLASLASVFGPKGAGSKGSTLSMQEAAAEAWNAAAWAARGSRPAGLSPPSGSAPADRDTQAAAEAEPKAGAEEEADTQGLAGAGEQQHVRNPLSIDVDLPLLSQAGPHGGGKQSAAAAEDPDPNEDDIFLSLETPGRASRLVHSIKSGPGAERTTSFPTMLKRTLSDEEMLLEFGLATPRSIEPVKEETQWGDVKRARLC